MKRAYSKPAARILTSQFDDVHNKRRSQRVMLQVALIIRIKTNDGKNLEAEARTLVVNAHGGLLESALMVSAHELITLIHPPTGKEARCRVVRTERAASGIFTVAFEFHERTADFWPITFPPEDWAEPAF